LVLQYWHGWPLVRIGEHLGRSTEAVAGLLKRGLKSLRTTFKLLETPNEIPKP
jgi:DNA-directed RNA polymerase specialized sigma24 family protein